MKKRTNKTVNSDSNEVKSMNQVELNQLKLKAALIVVANAKEPVIDEYVQKMTDYDISPAPDKTMEGFTKDKSPKVKGDKINEEYTETLQSYPSKQGTDKDIAKNASKVDKLWNRYVMSGVPMTKGAAKQVDRILKSAVNSLLGSKFEKNYAPRIHAILSKSADAQGRELFEEEEPTYEPDEEKMDRAKKRTRSRKRPVRRVAKKKQR